MPLKFDPKHIKDPRLFSPLGKDLAPTAGALLAGVITAAALATTRELREASGIVYSLVLVLLAAMAGFCLTGDLFNLFVFFELIAVCGFVLAAYHTESLTALRSALSFAITNSIGAFLVLIAIALLYGRTGTLNLAEIGRKLAAHPGPDRLVTVALALLVVGFLVKAAVVPFHFWLIDTVTGAPVVLVVILGGVLDSLGVYGIVRVYWTVFASASAGQHAVGAVLVALGAASALGAGALSLVFSHPRRRLGFVMVAHTGIVLIGAGCLSATGIAGSALYAAGDGTVKAALFIGLALLGFDEPADALRRIPGQVRRRAGVALLAAGGIATAGLPLFATGLGKAVIEDAASHAGYPWAAVCIVVAAVLTGAAVLEIALAARGSGNGPGDVCDHPWWLGAVGVALLAISAVVATAGRWASRAAAVFVSTAAYQQRVLGGPRVAPAVAPHVGLSAGGAVLDLIAVAGAAVLASGRARAAGPFMPATVSAAVRRAAGRAHDGSIGDSATWAAIGTAAITVVLAVSTR